jgi:hypothetical protein
MVPEARQAEGQGEAGGRSRAADVEVHEGKGAAFEVEAFEVEAFEVEAFEVEGWQGRSRAAHAAAVDDFSYDVSLVNSRTAFSILFFT